MMTNESKKADGRTGARKTIRFLPVAPLPENLPEGRLAIADMANAFGVTHRTLHFYEEKGLLRAARVGPMRVYGPEEIQQMAVVNTCRETGMPVAVIQELLDQLSAADSQDEADTIFRTAMTARKRELAAQQSTIRRQMQQINELLDFSAAHEIETNDNTPHCSFSQVELRCLTLMAEGYPTSRIARALEVEPGEVQVMEKTIISKFNSNNRFQAVAKAVMLGIVGH
ncbi:MerR family transcriptional regulator [Sinorhizobium sp. RAC02]|uniref:MerR family transcriptional regulator n=1 Tax=Sinorhizobium sp. RAC02 TaxID=1842534 RepID=UPI0008575773|nr:MerR family transcriptional regulator [Sinorhizobium sp. RAC02]AOF90461.1 bacterial regulatory s, luxR family protein [Sinorhizobium sp. RAC02]